MEHAMQRLFGFLLLFAAGCQGLAGPRVHRDNPVDLENTSLTISEQKRLVNDRLALPDPSPSVGPNIGTFPTR